MRYWLLVILIFTTSSLTAQEPSNTHTAPETSHAIAWPAFATRQDSLFMQAYNNRDTSQYLHLLHQFKQHWQQLTPQQQKNYGNAAYINAYYNLACIYALVHDKIQALANLQKAITAGYSNYANLKQDKDFDHIRSERQFIQLQATVRRVGDYQYILARGERYNKADTTAIPAFTYQLPTDTALQALRKTFNLDSIAGTGNDVCRVLNLLHWIHNLVPHDGNHENPVVKNAMNMIAVCKKDKRGLNCRGLATALNECYLALGYKARFVTCLPKDSLEKDPDCHVINVVYIPTLKKWIWIDPTWDAYVMNEKGELLGVEEVRHRLIHHQPLLLNPDANWNHKITATKADYLESYMAKNLYMLQCAVNSEYDTETLQAGKTLEYITLAPLDYHKQQERKKISTRAQTGATFIVHITNDPTKFWQQP